MKRIERMEARVAAQPEAPIGDTGGFAVEPRPRRTELVLEDVATGEELRRLPVPTRVLP